jgi:uncharacterized protein YecE (DUF72 family)
MPISVLVTIPTDYSDHLRIGTCSWKYDSWKGLYYDNDKTYGPNDYLPHYARHLNSVEVDQWFWSLFPGGLRLPDPETVRIYAESVPDDFVFTVKAPNALTLTHYYAKQAPQHVEFAGRPNIYFCDADLLQRFLDLLTPMGKKLGPVMFQYEFLNRAKMGSRQEFLDQLDRFLSKAPKGFEYGVETRNPDYLSRPLFDLLSKHRIAFVYIDGYHMPDIGEVFDRHQPATAPRSVIRLHGPDRTAIEGEAGGVWNRILSPKPEGLRAAARIVRANRRRGIATFLNVNNHYEGSAPITITRFLETLMGEE